MITDRISAQVSGTLWPRASHVLHGGHGSAGLRAKSQEVEPQRPRILAEVFGLVLILAELEASVHASKALYNGNVDISEHEHRYLLHSAIV